MLLAIIVIGFAVSAGASFGNVRIFRIRDDDGGKKR